MGEMFNDVIRNLVCKTLFGFSRLEIGWGSWRRLWWWWMGIGRRHRRTIAFWFLWLHWMGRRTRTAEDTIKKRCDHNTIACNEREHCLIHGNFIRMSQVWATSRNWNTNHTRLTSIWAVAIRSNRASGPRFSWLYQKIANTTVERRVKMLAENVTRIKRRSLFGSLIFRNTRLGAMKSIKSAKRLTASSGRRSIWA